MSGRLAGKNAFVTAAGQGIGRAVALAFAAEGAHVWATDVNDKLLEGYRGVANVTARRLDVLDDGAIEALTREAGLVNVLFNCTGFVHHGSVMEATDEQWNFAFNLNVRAHWKMIRAVLPGMLDHFEKTGQWSSIVNVASIAGSIRGIANRFVYGTTKAAVIGLTKSVAIDYVKRGIRCNCICPGTIQSPSLDDRIAALGRDVGGTDKARQMFIDRQPMGRLGTAEEVAHVAVYLASDESAFTTGQSFFVDGGFAL
jgi:2-keto-3-deoxy-L-fuconate dehydrogenase